MKHYVIAVLDDFDSEIDLFFKKNNDPVEAIKEVLVEMCDSADAKQTQAEFNKNLPGDLEKALDELFGVGLVISIQEIPKQEPINISGL